MRAYEKAERLVFFQCICDERTYLAGVDIGIPSAKVFIVEHFTRSDMPFPLKGDPVAFFPEILYYGERAFLCKRMVRVGPVPDRILACHQTMSGRRAHRGGLEEIGEPYPFLCEPVDVRCSGIGAAIASEITESAVIGNHDDYVRPFFLLPFLRIFGRETDIRPSCCRCRNGQRG